MDITSPWGSSGISVVYTKTSQQLRISGWFDSIVGIEGRTIELREFFDALGITEDTCRKAFTDKKCKEQT